MDVLLTSLPVLHKLCYKGQQYLELRRMVDLHPICMALMALFATETYEAQLFKDKEYAKPLASIMPHCGRLAGAVR